MKLSVENSARLTYRQKSGIFQYMLETMSNAALSDTLKNLPIVAVDYVFISPEKRSLARTVGRHNKLGG